MCVVVVAATATIGAMRWNAGLTPFCILLALFAVGAWSDRRRAGAGLALAYAGIGVLALLRAPYFDHPLALVFVVAVTTSWALGRAMSRGRSAREGAVARALEAERARAMAAERAVLAERLHIARELHDVVSHTLSVIAVQSGVARHRLEHGPSHDRQSAVVPALAAIETASRARPR